ncbi:MAG: bifunctional ornithine acetyltransferase/N-acetylglutamate synthase [Pirellulaceae bacterium]
MVADGRVAAAGVYTTNLIHAASIDWNRAAPIEQGMRGLVINSGNANACTGSGENRTTPAWRLLPSASVGDDPQSFFVMSTGVIGHFLPMGKLESGIPSVAKSLSAGAGVRGRRARHHDDRPIHESRVSVPGNSLGHRSHAAMAKGAGMIGLEDGDDARRDHRRRLAAPSCTYSRSPPTRASTASAWKGT